MTQSPSLLSSPPVPARAEPVRVLPVLDAAREVMAERESDRILVQHFSSDRCRPS